MRQLASPSRRAVPILAATLILCAGLLSACASDDPNRSGLLQPYRFNLPQGNYVTRDMLDQVKPGMTREQVRFILGSPLLSQSFRGDRWDYVYRFQHANGSADVRRALIRFADDRVSAVESSALPQRDDPDDPALPGWHPRKNIPAPTTIEPQGLGTVEVRS